MKFLMVLVLCTSNLFAAQEVYVGFVSDSGCARARASGGKFTPTNPDCARKCVKEGKSIVLVSPEKKLVFDIDNPELLRSQVGNKVRVYARAAGAQLLHVDKVVFLEKTNPECERPPLKN